MKSIEDFRALIKSNADRAMRDYVVHIDQSLDGMADAHGVLVSKGFGEQNVEFVFEAPNIINMRSSAEGGASSKRIWYLPWISKRAARADLDGSGSRYFSTSQLNGCRFTVQYADASKRNVTVLHVAGDFDFKDGSTRREELEAEAIGPVVDPARRRRYSIGQSKMEGSVRFGLQHKIDDETRVYYGGQKASIFGYRNKAGAWDFWAQEMTDNWRGDTGLGHKTLT